MYPTLRSLSSALTMSNHSLNRDATVAVSNVVYWEDDMSECPINVKVQLYSIGGMGSHGTWDGKDDFFIKWAPLPRVRKKPNAIHGKILLVGIHPKFEGAVAARLRQGLTRWKNSIVRYAANKYNVLKRNVKRIGATVGLGDE